MVATTTIPEEGNESGLNDGAYISRDEVDDEVGPMLRRREEENDSGEG